MKNLIGSEKQITWAEQIRTSQIKKIQNEIDTYNTRIEEYNDFPSGSHALEVVVRRIAALEKCIARLSEIEDSKYFIDHKGIGDVLIQRSYDAIK